ncbi:MAG: UDP-glucose--hexose-1-phosphate uridylyltransferase [Clostridiales bacterium]|nr:UDP-glucose--hexose-1-phosphate uridylyltransferase [Clostridiales bacterium]
MRDIKELIEICTQFAVKKGLCYKVDMSLIRNRLMSLFNVTSIFEDSVEIPESIIPVLEEMVDYAAEKGMLEMNTAAYRAMFDTKICGCMLMMQSQAQEIFKNLYEESPEKATNWFYDLCRDINYIRTADVAKNIKYDYESSYGTMEITINLTKPEKDPKEIEKQKSMPQTNYPKCMLCLENVGYQGRLGYPSHETLRTIPIELDNETWNFQYSPYVYYDEHCIVFCSEHTPMTMNKRKFVRLFDFIKKFPHYFIGSNTQLPVVGGSILTHEHFQGGRHIMPMEKAEDLYVFDCKENGVKASIVNWPMTCIRLSSQDCDKVIKVATNILETWQNYSDESLNIFAYTDGIEHNTITPIARINSNGLYECDIVLRNNLTTEEFPLGVYHPHPNKHNIKKENIGLIEVMGLFILPGRLKTELDDIANIWINKQELDKTSVHYNWFNSFKDNYKPDDFNDAIKYIYNIVGEVCENVLRDAGVFKEDEEGKEGLKKFLVACGFEV